jgi:hypothetical protein
MRKKHDHFWGYMTISVVRKATISVAIDSLWNSPPAGSTTRWGWQCTTIAPFLGGAGRFRVLSACGVAGQLTICSLTIDDFSVPRRQTQQSSIPQSSISSARPVSEQTPLAGVFGCGYAAIWITRFPSALPASSGRLSAVLPWRWGSMGRPARLARSSGTGQ